MTTARRIAVLIPAYNPGEGLSVTLESMRRQTVPYHLFLVDDGSTRKPNYTSALLGIPHTLLELPQNAGITRALNAGLDACLKSDCTYIARMDCGDEMASDRLELQSKLLDERPEVAVVGSWIEMHYGETGRRFTLQWPVEHDGIVNGLWKNMSLTHPALMFRRSTFETLSNYSTNYEAAEDYELCRRAMKVGLRFHNIPKALLIKSETRDSITWRKRRTQLSSRLRAQWHYRDLSNPKCIAGLAKTTVTLMVPNSMVHTLKALVSKS